MALSRKFVRMTVPMFLAICLLGSIGQAASLRVAWGASQLPQEIKDSFIQYGAANGIDVEVVPRTGSWANHYERVLVAHLGGQPFDVIYIGTDYVPTADKGVFADLTPFILRDKIPTQQFVPQALEAFRWKGAQYAIPSDTNSNGIWYNVDRFREVGLPNIPSNWETVGDNWTWDDFVEAAKKLTLDRNNDGVFDQLGLGTLPPWLHAPWLWSGDWLDDKGRPAITSDAVVTGITRFAELAYQHRVVNAPQVRHSVKGGFPGGQVGMVFYGVTQVMTLNNVKWDYAVGALPKGTSRLTTFYTDGFAIDSLSPNKEAAWKLVKAFTMDNEYAAPLFNSLGLPAYRPLHSTYLPSTTKKYPNVNWYDFANSQFHGVLPKIRFSPNFLEIESLIASAYAKVTAGEQSAYGALSSIEARIQQLY